MLPPKINSGSVPGFQTTNYNIIKQPLVNTYRIHTEKIDSEKIDTYTKNQPKSFTEWWFRFSFRWIFDRLSIWFEIIFIAKNVDFFF